MCTHNIRFGEISELFIWVLSSVYPQYMFWWRNKKNIFNGYLLMTTHNICFGGEIRELFI